MGKQSLLKDKREEILRVAREHGALGIRVFGSYARGQAQPDSDVDLIVELGPEQSLLDLIAIKQEIEDAIHTRVDVVTEASLSPYLRDEILREAVSL